MAARAPGSQRRAQELAEADRLYQTLAEAAPVGIFRTDARGTVTWANERCFEIGGLPRADVFSGGWIKWVAPEQQARVQALIADGVAKGLPIAVEVHLSRPDGRAVTVWVQSVSERDDDGRVVGYVGTLSDLSQLRRTEAALRDSETRYRTLAEAIPVGVYRADRQGRALYVNRKLCELTGLREAEVMGRATVQHVHPEDRERTLSAAARSLAEGTPFSCELRFLHADGRSVWVLAQAVPERDASGEVVGFVGTITDISERKRAEAELEGHREGLEELVAERTAQLERSHERLRRTERLAAVGTFAAGIAHQINNPVGSILAAAQFAQESASDPQVAHAALGDIASDAKRCGRIVRSVLEFARGDQRSREPGDPNDVARSALSHLSGYAAEQGVVLATELAEALPRVLMSAPGLEQALTNVLENALDAGATRVTLRSFATAGDVVLRVEDDGVGVAAEDRDYLFDPFFTTRRGRGGTGLGLSIAHGIVAAHGGSIDLESEPSRGTRVTVRLPRIAAEGA